MVTDLPMEKNAWAKEVSGFVSSEDLFAAEGAEVRSRSVETGARKDFDRIWTIFAKHRGVSRLTSEAFWCRIFVFKKMNIAYESVLK